MGVYHHGVKTKNDASSMGIRNLVCHIFPYCWRHSCGGASYQPITCYYVIHVTQNAAALRHLRANSKGVRDTNKPYQTKKVNLGGQAKKTLGRCTSRKALCSSSVQSPWYCDCRRSERKDTCTINNCTRPVDRLELETAKFKMHDVRAANGLR